MANLGYAVIDMETTGLFPGGSDRILEISIITLDAQGKLIDIYTTLVNPKRDVGPTHIHGITASAVAHAPQFPEIAGDIISRIVGKAFVAHNAAFDRRFLHSELKRMGLQLPEIPTLCTMHLANLVDPAIPGRKLGVLCNYFKIPLANAHSAEEDAKATEALFRLCVEKIGGWRAVDVTRLSIKPFGSTVESWPDIKKSGFTYRRSDAVKRTRERGSYLSRLISSLPMATDQYTDINEYLDLLDRVLEDRRIDTEEYHRLMELALDMGMSQEQAMEAHLKYMQSLVLAALEDGIITPSEAADLEQVRQILGIEKQQANAIMEKAEKKYHDDAKLRCHSRAKNGDIVGKSICFTGCLTCRINGELASRPVAETAAQNAGMVLQKGVTKKLDILVVADPDTMSGKAKKAHSYGVRIIAEPVFWRMVGVGIE